MSWPKVATLSQLVARALRRPPAHKAKLKPAPPAKAYIAEGGPYNGRVLALEDGNTAPLNVGGQRGQYRVGLSSRQVAGPHIDGRVQSEFRRWKERGMTAKEAHDAVIRENHLGTTVWTPALEAQP